MEDQNNVVDKELVYIDPPITVADNSGLPLASRDRLSTLHIIGICCAWFSFQVAYTIEYAIATPIMKMFNFSSFQVGFVWWTGPVAGLFVQPILGAWSDTARWKLGRRRPLIIAGIILTTACFVMMFYIEKIFNKIKISWCRFVFLFILMLLTNCSINAIQVPAHAIVGDLVPQHQQEKANKIGAVLTSIAAFITNMIGGVNYFLKSGLADEYQNKIIIFVGTVMLIIFGVITVLCGKEEQLIEIPARENKVAEVLRALKTIPKPIFKISIVYALSWLAYFPTQTLTTVFFGDLLSGKTTNPNYSQKDYAKGVSFGMFVMACSNALVVIFSFLQGYLRKKVGLKITYCISQVLAAGSLCTVFFLKNRWALFGAFSLLSPSSLVFNSVPFEVVACSVSLEEMGTYMAIVNAFAVVGQLLSNLVLVSGMGSIKGGSAISSDGISIGSGTLFAILAAIGSLYIDEPGAPLHDISRSFVQTSLCDPIR